MIVLDAAEYPQGSDPWLQARCGVATASRFAEARAKVSGLDDRQRAYVDAMQTGKSQAEALSIAGYKSAPTSKTVARALAGEAIEKPAASALAYACLIAMETIARKPMDDIYVNYAMRRGRELEPQARRVYERRTGALVDEVSLVLTDDSHFGYSSDGLRDDDEVDGPGMIEIKCPLDCATMLDYWRNPGTAHLPYLDQMDGGMWITGRRWCDLVIYCPELAPVGKDLLVRRIYRDEARIEALEADLLDFWRLVEANLVVLRTPTTITGRPLDAAEPEAAVAPQASTPAEPPPADTTPPKSPDAYAGLDDLAF